jgi:hypothetical protein
MYKHKPAAIGDCVRCKRLPSHGVNEPDTNRLRPVLAPITASRARSATQISAPRVVPSGSCFAPTNSTRPACARAPTTSFSWSGPVLPWEYRFGGSPLTDEAAQPDTAERRARTTVTTRYSTRACEPRSTNACFSPSISSENDGEFVSFACSPF